MKGSLMLLAACAALPAFAADELAAKKQICMSCHAIDSPSVGPAFKAVAAKYAGDAAAAKVLAAKILKGGVGVWGQTPMPAITQVNAAEANKLVSWVLSLK